MLGNSSCKAQRTLLVGSLRGNMFEELNIHENFMKWGKNFEKKNSEKKFREKISKIQEGSFIRCMYVCVFFPYFSKSILHHLETSKESLYIYLYIHIQFLLIVSSLIAQALNIVGVNSLRTLHFNFTLILVHNLHSKYARRQGHNIGVSTYTCMCVYIFKLLYAFK